MTEIYKKSNFYNLTVNKAVNLLKNKILKRTLPLGKNGKIFTKDQIISGLSSMIPIINGLEIRDNLRNPKKIL